MAKTLVKKLTDRLQTLGVPARKAGDMAKGLAPTVRSAVKAEMQAKDKLATEILHAPLPPPSTVKVIKGKPVQIDGHLLRLDLPILDYRGGQLASVFRVMDGLTSTRSYVVIATKGGTESKVVIAARRYSEQDINVKFYPDMETWGITVPELQRLGAESHLSRQWYERMHMPPAGVEKLLHRYAQKTRTKKVIDRIVAVTYAPVAAAFKALYGAIAA